MRRHRLCFLLAAATGLMGLPPARSQPQSGPAFEVASVKQVEGGGLSLSPQRAGGRIHWITTRYLLVLYAFDLQQWRISGLDPDMVFYQIDATTDPSATTGQIRSMLQTLLAGRFNLVVHRETRDLNGYALTAGRSGLRIKPVAPDDKAVPLPEYFRGKGDDFAAGIEGRILLTKEGKETALTARRVSMSQLAQGIQDPLNAFVVDETAIPGQYYFAFKFAKDDSVSDAPSLADALQNELGVKLEKRKGPVEILVIDHLEKAPAEN